MLAVWGVDALATLIPEMRSAESHSNLVQSGPVPDVPIDGLVLAVAIGVTLLTGILFGLAPMLHAWKQNLVESLNATGRGSSRGRAGQRVLHVLVCGQVAAALVLLIASVLMIQSFARLLNVDPGFEPRQLLTGTVEFTNYSYEGMADRDEATRRLLDGVEKIPGVISACGIHELPLDRPGRWTRIVIREDQQHAAPGTPLATSDLEPVTPNYFQTMQIPLLSGRPFNEWDNRDNPPVAIINQKLALRLWPDGSDPVGKKSASVIRSRASGVFRKSSAWSATLEVCGSTSPVPQRSISPSGRCGQAERRFSTWSSELTMIRCHLQNHSASKSSA